jgi:hypothetical protein
MIKQFGAGLVLAAAVTVVPARAQAPQAVAAPETANGTRAMRVATLIMGTIRQVDRGKGAIEVQMLSPGAEIKWVNISSSSQIFVQSIGTIRDLKPNDTIVVVGVPTAIRAYRLHTGQMAIPRTGTVVGNVQYGVRPAPPTAAPGVGTSPPGTGGAAPAAAVPPSSGQPGAASPMVGNPSATVLPPSTVGGIVVSTSPLVVALPGDIRLTVEAPPSALVTRMIRATIGDLKVGHTLMAAGQLDASGGLLATRVDVGVDLPANVAGSYHYLSFPADPTAPAGTTRP